MRVVGVCAHYELCTLQAFCTQCGHCGRELSTEAKNILYVATIQQSHIRVHAALYSPHIYRQHLTTSSHTRLESANVFDQEVIG